jgi:hypothetical protein
MIIGGYNIKLDIHRETVTSPRLPLNDISLLYEINSNMGGLSFSFVGNDNIEYCYHKSTNSIVKV